MQLPISVKSSTSSTFWSMKTPDGDACVTVCMFLVFFVFFLCVCVLFFFFFFRWWWGLCLIQNPYGRSVIYGELPCRVTGLARAIHYGDLVTLASTGAAADSDFVLRGRGGPGTAQHRVHPFGQCRMGGLRVHRLHEPDAQHRAVTAGGTVPERVLRAANVFAHQVRPPHRTVSCRPGCRR